MQSLVTTDWLAGELGKSDLRIVDATWFLPDLGREARAEFDASHIPGAVFFDIDESADTSSPYPTMLPSPEKFASRMQALGLGDGCRVVVYDNSPYHTAARAWWTMRVFGVHQVAVLDGGFQKWRAEQRPVESGKPVVRHRHFTVWHDPALVRGLKDMIVNLTAKQEQVIDARSASRFQGRDPEPRPGVRPGHMPGALNLPYTELFNEDGTYKSGDALKAAFDSIGIDYARPVVTTCGSGITASTVAFGLHLLGHTRVSVYDGSWAEWGAQPTTPVVTS
jgi:thiosulfate/3-mercaptopyruvate sulfurtransferase